MSLSLSKTIGTGEESAYSRYMQSATFLISDARTLTKVVDGVDALDMNNRDAMGDVYEYILGKMAASGTNGQFPYTSPHHPYDCRYECQPTPNDFICDLRWVVLDFLGGGSEVYQGTSRAGTLYGRIGESISSLRLSMAMITDPYRCCVSEQ